MWLVGMANAAQIRLVNSSDNLPEKFPLSDGGQCGGSCHSGRNPDLAPPRDLLSVELCSPNNQCGCACGGHDLARQWLALTGFVLGAVLLLQLIVRAFGLWPALFDLVAGLSHGLAAALPSFGIGLVFVPLAIHVTLGLRVLRRDKLKFAVEKPHSGGDARYWLQRLTAVILLGFLSFHLATTRRPGLLMADQDAPGPAAGRHTAAGLFEPQRAFASVSQAQWHFWNEHTANPANLLVSELYLLAIVAAVYHLVNGVATGAEVLGFVTARSKDSLWRVCMGAGFLLAAIGMAGWYAFIPGTHP